MSDQFKPILCDTESDFNIQNTVHVQNKKYNNTISQNLPSQNLPFIPNNGNDGRSLQIVSNHKIFKTSDTILIPDFSEMQTDRKFDNNTNNKSSDNPNNKSCSDSDNKPCNKSDNEFSDKSRNNSDGKSNHKSDDVVDTVADTMTDTVADTRADTE